VFDVDFDRTLGNGLLLSWGGSVDLSDGSRTHSQTECSEGACKANDWTK
jgi:hypothetical protein